MAKKKGVDKGDESSKNNDSDLSSNEEPNFSDPEGFVDDIPDSGEHFRWESFGHRVRIQHV